MENDSMVEHSGYLRDICEMLKKKWPENRTIAIACHGHSVPSGYFKTPVIKPFSSYPHLLHRAIKARFPFAAINVIVTAIGGETSEHGAERFGKDVLAVRPDVITIDYGLNDCNIGLENAKKAWISMIELAKTRNIKILLMTPTPDTAYQADDQKQSLQQYARQIRALAAKFKVGLVDSLSVFDKQLLNGILLKSLLSHINHPNAKGHKLVVNELIKWFPE